MSNPTLIHVHGIPFMVRPLGWDFWNQVDRGTWEPETFEALDRYLSPERDCVDIGAWVGPITLYASRKARKVFAVEPDPVAVLGLLDNLALNNTEKRRVIVINAALGPADEWLGFGTETSFGDSQSSVLAPPMIQVPAVSFATLMRVMSPSALGFIKMDIEGGEESVLPVMAGWLRALKPPLLISFHPPHYRFPGAAQLLSACLAPYAYQYILGRGVPTTANVEEIAVRIGEGNNFTVLAADEEWVPK